MLWRAAAYCLCLCAMQCSKKRMGGVKEKDNSHDHTPAVLILSRHTSTVEVIQAVVLSFQSVTKTVKDTPSPTRLISHICPLFFFHPDSLIFSFVLWLMLMWRFGMPQGGLINSQRGLNWKKIAPWLVVKGKLENKSRLKVKKAECVTLSELWRMAFFFSLWRHREAVNNWSPFQREAVWKLLQQG